MLALRSLCYFYLVRNFRDVPYVTQAFMNSSQNFDVPQMNPEYVLLQCIKDLEEAERNAISPLAYTNWMRVGYLNRDGIDALMADIYLWLASVKNDNAYYKKSVEYCDKVIQSKQAQYRATDAGAGLADDAFPLIEGRMMFNRLFVQQNGSESIFELQFDGRNNSNTGVCEMFNRYYSSAAGPSAGSAAGSSAGADSSAAGVSSAGADSSAAGASSAGADSAAGAGSSAAGASSAGFSSAGAGVSSAGASAGGSASAGFAAAFSAAGLSDSRSFSNASRSSCADANRAQETRATAAPRARIFFMFVIATAYSLGK